MTDGETAWSFSYNADGMRTQRTNGTDTYEYIYNGGSLSQMTVGSQTLRFGYSASGVPLYVQWNNSRYFYVTNQQGDVTAIVSVNGIPVVEYTYDAWGNPLTTTGTKAATLGKLNPLRYRSYVYDQEMGLYYLQSRYYDPEMGRFINADALISTGQGLLGNNMFAYCNNNPIINKDVHGTIPAKHSGAYGSFDPLDFKAYWLEMQTEIVVDKKKGEIIANFPIQNNPQASYLDEQEVAKKYSKKLHDHIEDIADTYDQTLEIMSEEHIYSELLAHYYVYVGLDSYPIFQIIPQINDAYMSATTATLNPSENRKEVLLIMEIISWTYGE